MSEDKSVVIKKYPNRRLYNTATSSYITLEDIANMVKACEKFIVLDAKTSEDLTRLTLTQIILEHESKGYDLLPMELLVQIIRFYDHELAHIFHSYLFMMMEYFNNNRDSIENMMQIMRSNFQPMEETWSYNIEEFTKQNREWMEMMQKFNLFMTMKK